VCSLGCRFPQNTFGWNIHKVLILTSLKPLLPFACINIPLQPALLFMLMSSIDPIMMCFVQAADHFFLKEHECIYVHYYVSVLQQLCITVTTSLWLHSSWWGYEALKNVISANGAEKWAMYCKYNALTVLHMLLEWAETTKFCSWKLRLAFRIWMQQLKNWTFFDTQGNSFVLFTWRWQLWEAGDRWT
jgi:hypothetical protein